MKANQNNKDFWLKLKYPKYDFRFKTGDLLYTTRPKDVNENKIFIDIQAQPEGSPNNIAIQQTEFYKTYCMDKFFNSIEDAKQYLLDL